MKLLIQIENPSSDPLTVKYNEDCGGSKASLSLASVDLCCPCSVFAIERAKAFLNTQNQHECKFGKFWYNLRDLPLLCYICLSLQVQEPFWWVFHIFSPKVACGSRHPPSVLLSPSNPIKFIEEIQEKIHISFSEFPLSCGQIKTKRQR